MIKLYTITHIEDLVKVHIELEHVFTQDAHAHVMMWYIWENQSCVDAWVGQTWEYVRERLIEAITWLELETVELCVAYGILGSVYMEENNDN